MGKQAWMNKPKDKLISDGTQPGNVQRSSVDGVYPATAIVCIIAPKECYSGYRHFK